MAIRMNKTALALWVLTTFACLVLSTATTTQAASNQTQFCSVAQHTAACNTVVKGDGVRGE